MRPPIYPRELSRQIELTKLSDVWESRCMINGSTHFRVRYYAIKYEVYRLFDLDTDYFERGMHPRSML
jgi:hypothetical protein